MPDNNLPPKFPDIPKPPTPDSFAEMEQVVIIGLEETQRYYDKQLENLNEVIHQLQKLAVLNRNFTMTILRLVLEKEVFDGEDWEKAYRSTQVDTFNEQFKHD